MKNEVGFKRNERWSPTRELGSLHQGINRLFEDFMTPWRDTGEVANWEGTGGTFMPPVDVEERNDAYQIAMDVPGLKKDDLHIDVSGNLLTVSGERKTEKTETKRNTYFSERSYGSFTRRFTLPPGVKADKITADYRDGELMIVLPKGEASAARRIEIGEGEKKGLH